MKRKRRRTQTMAKRLQTDEAAIMVLHQRLQKCERALGITKRQIGFTADAVGDRIEQDPDDADIPEET